MNYNSLELLWILGGTKWIFGLSTVEKDESKLTLIFEKNLFFADYCLPLNIFDIVGCLENDESSEFL